MKREQLNTELQQIAGADRTKLDALARKISDEAREPVRETVRIWSSSDPALSQKAARLLAGLEDLALVPMLEVKGPERGPQRVWRLRQLVRVHLSLRNEIATALNAMLDDRSLLPPPEGGGPVDEPFPDERLCDVAYLEMRRLLNPGESKADYYPNMSIFLHLSFSERDDEIRKARQSRTWTDWTGAEEAAPPSEGQTKGE